MVPLIEESKPTAKAVTCPSCGGQVDMRALGETVTAICKHCDALLDTSHDQVKYVTRILKRGKEGPVIPLGARGILFDTLWEVIGYLERSDDGYPWGEYLLYHPLKGFRWLVEADGKWSFVKPVKHIPTEFRINEYKLGNKVFKLFHSGSAKVEFVKGEFYWQVRVGDTVDTEDYVAPPQMLSLEKNGNEQVWSLGQYVESKMIREAFGGGALPLEIGVAPHEPFYMDFSSITKIWGLSVAMVLLTQCAYFGSEKKETVLHQGFQFKAGEPDRSRVSDPFKLLESNRNLEVELRAPVVNAWVEFQMELVNDDNGKTYPFEVGVEHYAGVTAEGERWMEGSKYSTALISSVPKGNYHLNMDVNGYPRDFKAILRVDSGVVMWSNLIWTFVLISLLPVLALVLLEFHNIKRWSRSDFSPYDTDDE